MCLDYIGKSNFFVDFQMFIEKSNFKKKKINVNLFSNLPTLDTYKTLNHLKHIASKHEI